MYRRAKPNLLVGRNVHACDSWHASLLLTLTLLVAGVLADDADHAACGGRSCSSHRFVAPMRELSRLPPGPAPDRISASDKRSGREPRSYGEISTVTLSPGRMRIQFIRIRPDTCASTSCPFSSATRNMAFGSASLTVASTRIGSSFAMLPFLLRAVRQDLRPVLR